MAEQLYPLSPGDQPPGEPSATAPLSHNLEHKAQGLARLIAQYIGKPRLENLLCVYLNQIQDAEDALWELATERFVDTAVGAQLDVLGVIVGQERQGLSDDDYRALIRARIKANNSEGTSNDIRGVVVAALNDPPAGTVKVEELTIASFEVRLFAEVSFDEHILNGLLQDARAAGVRAILIIPMTAAANVFVFAPTSADNQFDADAGFDSATTPNTGLGQLSRALDEQTG